MIITQTFELLYKIMTSIKFPIVLGVGQVVYVSILSLFQVFAVLAVVVFAVKFLILNDNGSNRREKGDSKWL